MAKALFVIAPKDFKDPEYYTPKEILENAGVEVTTASLKEEAVSVDGKVQKVDVLLEDVNTDYDVIIFVGGAGASAYFDNAKAHELAKEMTKDGKVIAAICIAPSTLANAGLLEGRNVTSFPSQENNIKAKGANYTAEAVTVDGKIITAMNPAAAEEFGNEIVKALS
ncbi:DJ-1/PfpI family protein, partial [Nanoarchaeota archaeon]